MALFSCRYNLPIPEISDASPLCEQKKHTEADLESKHASAVVASVLTSVPMALPIVSVDEAKAVARAQLLSQIGTRAQAHRHSLLAFIYLYRTTFLAGVRTSGYRRTNGVIYDDIVARLL